MSQPLQSSARVAIVIGFVLVAISFAPLAGAQIMTTTTSSMTRMALFSHDLTLGSTGADVTALQMWLIGEGFNIPAGATGYFGAQTKSSLAAYQASVGISPAAGFFGAITRARTNITATITPISSTPATQLLGSNQDHSKSDADDAIMDAEELYAEAKGHMHDASSNHYIQKSEDLLKDANAMIKAAKSARDDNEYDIAVSKAHIAKGKAEDAKDSMSTSVHPTSLSSDDIETSAKTTFLDGNDNDYAAFKIELPLTPFGDELFVAKNPSVSINYQIENSNGNVVGSATRQNTVLQSSADSIGDYFVFNEDNTDTLTLTVVFDPLSSDEGLSFRLHLLGVNYNSSEASPNLTWAASSNNTKFQTDYVYVGD